MDSFFGIGIAELFFIAILALIILGPERLPGALREVAKVIRYVRNLTNELTNQFGDEMKAFDDLNPQKIFNEMIEDPEEKKKAAEKAKAKPAPKPAAKTTTTTPKPATPKPATAKPATAKPAVEKPAADAAGAATEAAETPKRVTQPTIKGPLLPSATAAAKTGDDHADQTDAPATTAGEPSILPPAAAEAAVDNAKSDDDNADKKADKVMETPARSTTVAVNGTAASVDGSEA